VRNRSARRSNFNGEFSLIPGLSLRGTGPRRRSVDKPRVDSRLGFGTYIILVDSRWPAYPGRKNLAGDDFRRDGCRLSRLGPTHCKTVAAASFFLQGLGVIFLASDQRNRRRFLVGELVPFPGTGPL